MADDYAAACSSTMSGSASTSFSQYHDVFINHCGPDLRDNFATRLYRSFQPYGLQVFIDKSEMQVGHDIPSQIESAIQIASVHVAIFSRRYAESTWCLNELVWMLKSGKPIIPVFYDVKPEHLRWTGRSKDGPYAIALRRHEEKQRHEIQTIQEWRKALSDVANISGLEPQAFNGDIDELLDKLVQSVLQKVPPKLDVTNYPTGLEDKVENFERTVLLHQQGELRVEAKVVGIVGLNGVGKTTLAKYFFNRNKSNYDGSSSLFDVGENATRGNLSSLQSKLISDLKHEDIKIDRVEEGIDILKKKLSSCHALIIFDEVDAVNQLDAFLPIKYALDPKSVILVTSRYKHVLISAGIEESSIYHLEGLSRLHSRELFCACAFLQRHPPPEFEDLVDRFLMACSGLPLTLKMFGAVLCGENNRSHWEDLLDGLHRTLPAEIHQALRITYDFLDVEEQQMFLDIACFFIGKDRDMAIRIWNGSGWKGLAGFRNLQSKFLVQVDSENKIGMQNHIKDFGINIADSSKLMSRRLWQPVENLQDFHDFLEQSSSSGSASTFQCVTFLGFLFKEICRLPWYDGSSSLKYLKLIPTKLRGLRMAVKSTVGDTCEERLLPSNTSSRDDVIGISQLQLLEAEGDFLESISTSVWSSNLIWLHWSECPYSSFPSWIPIHNLRVLEVAGRELQRLWQYEFEAPLQLRELNIDAPLLEFPKSLRLLKHLEKIVLKYKEIEGTHLETLPEEFCDLQSLKYLELKRCYKLKILPELFGNLTNLQQINLSMCESLEILPNSFGNLTHLLQIDLSSCKSLKSLPNSLGNLTELQYINMSICESLKMLPVSLGNLTNLHDINLSSCRSLQVLPDSLGNLTSLQCINLSCCQSLNRLPDSLGNLRNLQRIDLQRCQSLKMLPNSLENLTALQHIDLMSCESLKMLPNSFGNFRNLRRIDLSFCKSLETLPNSFGNLRQLEHLHLKGCCSLTMSSETLGSIGRLVCLDLEGCLQMELFPPQVGRQPLLQKLNLLDTKLQELPPLSSSLEALRLGSPVLEMLPPSLDCLTRLKELWLHGCQKLRCLPDSVGLLAQLAELNIQKCGLEYLPPAVMEMNSLKILRVHRCPLRELPFKKVQGKRKSLSLTESRGKRASSELDSKGMMQLKELELYRTEISEVIIPEGVCSNLRDLTIVCCKDLVEVGALPTRLKTLDIRYCSALQKMGGLYGLANLETLDMRGCNNIQVEELPGFETLESLKVIKTPLRDNEEEEAAAFEEGVLREKKRLKIFCKGEEIL